MSYPRRLLILTLVCALTSALAYFPLRETRREAAVKRTLLTIQHALQHYHVDQERYVPELKMSGARLVQILVQDGFLPEPPLNPYTAKPFSVEAEADGEDRLIYRTDEAFETYSLQALRFDRDEVWLEIDSVEHHSFE